jgi:hypothetical protein
MSALFDNERRRSECSICASVPNTSSRIEVPTILYLIYHIAFVNRMALAKVSTELTAIYFHSFEIFTIQIGELAFCKPEFIIIKPNYFQSAQKDECFLDDLEALVRERRFYALVFQNGLRLHRSAQTSYLSFSIFLFLQ